MGNANLETLRRLGAKYWQVIVTSVTTVLTGVTVFYDFNDKSPGLKTALAVTVGLFIVIAIRFPRVAIKLTKIIFGPTPLPPNPPQIFRGPRPYVRGETLPGRQAEVERCLLSLQQTPFLLLEGESGCGKSSLLNAALLPAAHASFRVVECRVAEDPFGKMILALGRRPDPAGAGADGTQALLEAIKSAPDGAAAGGDAGKPLLICIDQFEELFVTVRDAVRNPFVAAMRDAIVGGHARFILGMRSDFTDLLLRICRTVDPEQQALDAGSYYSLKAFSGRTAKSVLDTMLEPLHNGDPLRKQQLEDFSDSLVQELLRPPRDKRLCQDDEKTVLPVELQTVGMMIESVGVENFSTEGYRRLGRKAGLLRAYIDEAKTYVWRKTGVSGDQALLVLRQLISPARTKWAQTPTSVGEALGLPPPAGQERARRLRREVPRQQTARRSGRRHLEGRRHGPEIRVDARAPRPRPRRGAAAHPSAGEGRRGASAILARAN